MISNAGTTTNGHTFEKIAAANARPLPGSMRRNASVAPHAASATGTRSKRV